MLVTAKKILDKAKKENYGVIAPNVFNLETIDAAVEAAAEENSPIILAYGESMEKYTNIYEFGAIATEIAYRSNIPIAIHLDHSFAFETCLKSIQAGFSSLMIDRSFKNYTDNVSETKEIVKIAHAVGVSVEAELGHVGSANSDNEEDYGNLTDPDLAADYVNKTGIDTLAIAIGTAHGVYKQEPCIDFERLKLIKNKVHIPLVLHGGSLTGDEQLARACREGICKVNIGTEIDLEAMAGFDSNLPEILKGWEFAQRLNSAKLKVKERVKHYIRLFGSSDKS